jgi:hypothetical protein
MHDLAIFILIEIYNDRADWVLGKGYQANVHTHHYAASPGNCPVPLAPDILHPSLYVVYNDVSYKADLAWDAT